MIAGRLRNVPLSEVFQVVMTGHKVGTLEVKSKGRVATLYCERGRIRYANLRPGVHLGEVMVRLDLLSVAEVQAILASQVQEHAGAPLGLAALRLGLIDEADLAAAVRRQVGEVISELLTWRDGAFRFTEAGTDNTYVPEEHAVDAMALLFEVAGRLQDEDAARVAPAAVFTRAADPTTVTLPDGAWEVLEAVDGRRSARAVAADLDMPERQVYGVLGRLEAVGVLRRLELVRDEPVVLVICASHALQRLLALVVERSGGVARLVSTPAEAITAAAAVRPHALLIDDDGTGWGSVGTLRSEPGLTHLPMLLMTNDSGHVGWRRWRRPKVDVMARPFDELALLEWLERWLLSASSSR